MARYKPYDEVQGYFITLTPSTQFKEYSIEKVIDQFVEEHVDIKLFEKGYKNDDNGRSAIHPYAKLKVILYAFSQNTYSSRKIEKLIRSGHVSYVFLSRNTQIDHSTLCEFIIKFQNEITEIFTKLLVVLNEMGLIDWDLIMIDGTKINSNASKEMTSDYKGFKKKLIRYKKLSEKIVERARRVDELEDNGTLSAESARKERERIKRQKQHYERIIDKIEEYEREVEEGDIGSKEKINLTDRDSKLLKTNDGYKQGYNVQAAWSGNDILLDIESTDKGNDNGQLKGRIKNVEDLKNKLNVEKESAYVSDKGYCNPRQITDLVKEGKNIYCDIPANIENGWINDKKYNVERDAQGVSYFSCVRGLKIRGYYDSKKDAYIFNVNRKKCSDCPQLSECWSSDDTKYRKFTLSSVFEDSKDIWDNFAKKMRNPESKYIYNKRIGKEHNFNDIKNHNGVNKIQRRGKIKATLEPTLAGIAHNLKKMAKHLEMQALLKGLATT